MSIKLPKCDFPIHNLTVPSTKKSHKFRPFLVKEEKILLMAKEGDNPADVLSAVKQIVNNCSIDNKFDIDKIALFDLEFLFLRLRALSVDNIVKVKFEDNEDKLHYDFEIDLNQVNVVFPDKINNKIKLTSTAGILLKFPPATLYDDEEFLNLDKNYMFELILRCLDKVYDGDTLYDLKDYTKEEQIDFLENLSIKTFEEIQSFLLNLPSLRHEIKYKNSLGNDRSITLTSLNSFFT
jgi:hypothetical protein